MTAAAEFATDTGPRHVAVIMDGNGRWAQARGMFRTAGHRSGMEAVRRIVESARALEIPYLTIFGFSAENWGRPVEEVEELMLLLRFICAARSPTCTRTACGSGSSASGRAWLRTLSI